MNGPERTTAEDDTPHLDTVTVTMQTGEIGTEGKMNIMTEGEIIDRSNGTSIAIGTLNGQTDVIVDRELGVLEG